MPGRPGRAWRAHQGVRPRMACAAFVVCGGVLDVIRVICG